MKCFDSVAERSRSGLADRYGRFGRTVNEPTPYDGELSYLLNRNDYDLPGQHICIYFMCSIQYVLYS